jgi:hypothetical protein
MLDREKSKEEITPSLLASVTRVAAVIAAIEIRFSCLTFDSFDRGMTIGLVTNVYAILNCWKIGTISRMNLMIPAYIKIRVVVVMLIHFLPSFPVK